METPKQPGVSARHLVDRAFGKGPEDLRQSAILAVLAAAALLPRLLILATTHDIPGDGPSRAVGALLWARHPTLVTHGGWLPGYDLLVGPLCRLLGSAELAPRLVNVTLGSATVLVLFALVQRVHGRTAALASTLLLAFVPLHVCLSATSLTEALFLFEILAGLALALRAARDPGRGRLVAALAVLVAAELTRYEAWPISLLVGGYLGLAARSWLRGAIAIAVLLAVPLAWSVSNQVHHGDALLGFHAAEEGAQAVGAHGIGALAAIARLVREAGGHLGWVVLAAVVAGVAAEVWLCATRRASLERLLYAAVAGLLFLGLWRAAAARGESLWDRYLVACFAVALPYAGVAVSRLRWPAARWAAIAALFGAQVVETSPRLDEPPSVCVTRASMDAVHGLCAWLEAQGLAETPVLFTKMDWVSTYVPLFAPQVDDYFIVSYWADAAALEDYVRRGPSVLVTSRMDGVFIEQVEAAFGHRFTAEDVLYHKGGFVVLDLPEAPRAAAP